MSVVNGNDFRATQKFNVLVIPNLVDKVNVSFYIFPIVQFNTTNKAK